MFWPWFSAAALLQAPGGSRTSCKMSRGRVENEGKTDPKLSQNAPLEAPGAPPEPWITRAVLRGYKIGPGALLEPSGGETKFTCRARGRPRKFPERFFSPPGPPGSILAPFCPLLGCLWGPCLAIFLERAKISFFANSPHENLDFQGSGSLPGGIFGTKNRSKNKLEAKTARTHTPGASKSLPERS